MKSILTIIFGVFIGMSSAKAVEVNCACLKQECKPVKFSLNSESENSKVYVTVDFIESSIEGYALIRKYPNKTIYSLGAVILIEDADEGFIFPGSDRICLVED